MVKKDDKLKVMALPDFQNRRLVTIPGLDKKQFRKLQSGEAVDIHREVFDPSIMREVTNGDS